MNLTKISLLKKYTNINYIYKPFHVDITLISKGPKKKKIFLLTNFQDIF